MTGAASRSLVVRVVAGALCAAAVGVVISGEGAADAPVTGLGLAVAAALLLSYRRLDWLLRWLALVSGAVLVLGAAVNAYDWLAERVPDPDKCDPFCAGTGSGWIVAVVLVWLLLGVGLAVTRALSWTRRQRNA